MRALPEGLGVGIYAYKRRRGGAWALDPDNPRTRSLRGMRNNVLSVGGAEEPLLFAPAAPFVVEGDRGGLVVTALVRKGGDGVGESGRGAESSALELVWSEREGTEGRVAMERGHEEDE